MLRRATARWTSAGQSRPCFTSEGDAGMPHVIVKLWPGKSEQQKVKLVEGVTNAVMTSLGYGEESVSVSLEEVAPSDWAEKVYKPDIAGKPSQLYKKPGYGPADLKKQTGLRSTK